LSEHFILKLKKKYYLAAIFEIENRLIYS